MVAFRFFFSSFPPPFDTLVTLLPELSQLTHQRVSSSARRQVFFAAFKNSGLFSVVRDGFFVFAKYC
jgi:hypothetical protein